MKSFLPILLFVLAATLILLSSCDNNESGIVWEKITNTSGESVIRLDEHNNIILAGFAEKSFKIVTKKAGSNSSVEISIPGISVGVFDICLQGSQVFVVEGSNRIFVYDQTTNTWKKEEILDLSVYRCIADAKTGTVYSWSQNAIFRRQGQNWSRLPLSESIVSIADLTIDQQSALWVVTPEGAIYVFRDNWENVINIQRPSYKIYNVADSNFWIYSDNNLLFLSPKGISHTLEVKSGKITALIQDVFLIKDKEYWIFSTESAWKFNGREFISIDLPCRNCVLLDAEMEQEKFGIYLLTSKGLFYHQLK